MRERNDAEDEVSSRRLAKTLDLLLTTPAIRYTQGDLARRLNVDKATMRRAIARLQRLGLIDVDVNPAGVRVKGVRFNDETEEGKALLDFYQRIAQSQ